MRCIQTRYQPQPHQGPGSQCDSGNALSYAPPLLVEHEMAGTASISHHAPLGFIHSDFQSRGALTR
eukprot:IDg18294t1